MLEVACRSAVTDEGEFLRPKTPMAANFQGSSCLSGVEFYLGDGRRTINIPRNGIGIGTATKIDTVVVSGVFRLDASQHVRLDAWSITRGYAGASDLAFAASLAFSTRARYMALDELPPIPSAPARRRDVPSAFRENLAMTRG